MSCPKARAFAIAGSLVFRGEVLGDEPRLFSGRKGESASTDLASAAWQEIDS